MLKLYKKTELGLLYWETWDVDSKASVVHWGKVGETGDNKDIKSTKSVDHHKIIQAEINKYRTDGYSEIDDDDHIILIIEYRIKEMGTSKDLNKRHKLEDRMNETLGWTGLGHCDGGSSGSGTMEICCFVVDFEIAKRVIEEDLKDTAFSDYTRIYDENDG